MGKIDEDMIFIIFIINSLGRHYPHLQSIIHGMTTDPNFTTALALNHLETEASLEDRRAELGLQLTTPPPAAANVATTSPLPDASPLSPGLAPSVVVNGMTYLLSPTPSTASSHSAHLCDHTSPPPDLVDFTGYIAEFEAPTTSLYWTAFSCPVELADYETQGLTASVSPSPTKCLTNFPFLLDTGGHLPYFPRAL
ncbi:hypothetical protein BC827DRAFT_1274526 [Russula dissimulans]|nr:hypothetical protein BC827DRAFT_1274526 [Russula dissimulans]